MPSWQENLQSQTMTLGEEDLVYAMGEPLNFYDEKVNVTIRGGSAD